MLASTRWRILGWAAGAVALILAGGGAAAARESDRAAAMTGAPCAEPCFFSPDLANMLAALHWWTFAVWLFAGAASMLLVAVFSGWLARRRREWEAGEPPDAEAAAKTARRLGLTALILAGLAVALVGGSWVYGQTGEDPCRQTCSEEERVAWNRFAGQVDSMLWTGLWLLVPAAALGAVALEQRHAGSVAASKRPEAG